MKYCNDWRVWRATDGVAFVVAKSAADAETLSREYWDESRDWTIVDANATIHVKRDPYKKDTASSLSMAAALWANRFVNCEWMDGVKPWFIIDKEIADDWFFGMEEPDEIKIGVKRDCPCGKEFECILCGGEGVIVRWIAATQNDDGLKLSSEDLDEAFGVLDAYSVLIDAGYRIVSGD